MSLHKDKHDYVVECSAQRGVNYMLFLLKRFYAYKQLKWDIMSLKKPCSFLNGKYIDIRGAHLQNDSIRQRLRILRSTVSGLVALIKLKRSENLGYFVLSKTRILEPFVFLRNKIGEKSHIIEDIAYFLRYHYLEYMEKLTYFASLSYKDG